MASRRGQAQRVDMGRRSLLGPLDHSRRDSAAAAAASPVVAGDDGLGPGMGRDQRAGSRAGAGVAHLPGRPVAAGLSDAGAPARPATTPLAADVLTAEATANGSRPTGSATRSAWRTTATA